MYISVSRLFVVWGSLYFHKITTGFEAAEPAQFFSVMPLLLSVTFMSLKADVGVLMLIQPGNPCRN